MVPSVRGTESESPFGPLVLRLRSHLSLTMIHKAYVD